MKAPDPRALAVRERLVPAEPPGARERILARVHATLGAPPGGGSGGGGASATSAASAGAKLVVILGGLAALAVLAVVVASSSGTAEPARAPASAPVPAAVPALAPPEAPPLRPPVASEPVRAAVAAPAPAPAPAVTPMPAPELAVAVAPAAKPVPRPEPALDPARAARLERELLDRGQAALAARDAGRALAAVDEHAHRFAHGALIEEREALRIRALMVAGRVAEARVAFVAFGKRFPSSIHLGAFDAALAP